MALPIMLPQGTTVLQRLFSEMPRSFSSDPQNEEVLQLYLTPPYISTDTISIVIADARMYINSQVNYIDSEIIDLRNITINDIINSLNGKYGAYGITAELAHGKTFIDGNYSATSLLEGMYDVGLSPTIIDRFTSNNFALLAAISIGLIDNEENMIAALTQTNLSQSVGKWTDYWGNLLGIPRLGNEVVDDIGYRNRIQREVVDQKSNNIAIQKLAEAATSRSINIVDGGQPFILAGSYNTNNGILATMGSSLAMATATAITFSGYILGSTLYVTSNPTYISTSLNSVVAAGYSISGSGISSGTTITALLSGSGWSGSTFSVNNSQSAGNSGSPITITGTYPITTADAAYRLGPTTGAGSFIVYVQKLTDEISLPQSLTASLTFLINQWKSAGVAFAIKSM